MWWYTRIQISHILIFNIKIFHKIKFCYLKKKQDDKKLYSLPHSPVVLGGIPVNIIFSWYQSPIPTYIIMFFEMYGLFNGFFVAWMWPGRHSLCKHWDNQLTTETFSCEKFPTEGLGKLRGILMAYYHVQNWWLQCGDVSWYCDIEINTILSSFCPALAKAKPELVVELLLYFQHMIP